MKKPATIQAFGVRLRAMRNERGWTQAELADRAEVGLATIYRIETGLHAASLDVLVCLAEALEVPLSELLTFEAPA